MSKEKRTKEELKKEANETITLFIDKYMEQFQYDRMDCLLTQYDETAVCPNDISCSQCNKQWIENRRKQLLDKYLLK